MEVQAYLGLFYAVRFWSGAVMVVGLVLFLLDVLALRPKPGRVSSSQERQLP
jgi:hypothetical protein